MNRETQARRCLRWSHAALMIISLFFSAPVHAIGPGRLFLPLGAESGLLEALGELWATLKENLDHESIYPLHPSASIGSSSRGRLLFAHQLRSAFGLHVMDPRDSFTTGEIALTLYALNALVRRAYPGGADLMIGDISRPNGGKFPPHRTHQHGLDVDLRYYIKQVPPGDHDKRFVHASKIDLPRMWLFLRLLKYYELASVVFMDSRLQKVIYEYARREGENEKTLGAYFTWPRRGRNGRALVQHIPNHYHHMHIRFNPGLAAWWGEGFDAKASDQLYERYFFGRTGVIEYRIQSGDTLGLIASKHQVRLRDLLSWNEITKTTLIRPGMVLKIWR